MTGLIFWLLQIAAFWHLYLAWPYIRSLGKGRLAGPIFPTRKNLDNPEFVQMWSYLLRFYGLLFASILWGFTFIIPAP